MKLEIKEASSKKYYVVYSICFVFTVLILSIPFIKSGKGLIQYHDMLQQYYYSFEYFSDYLQEIIRTLFESGKLEIPMWDFQIGMGADILTSLNYYVIGDPLNLISVFFKNSHLEYVFHFLLIFRVYLAGICFSMFSRKIGYIGWHTLGATYIYIFSIYTYYSIFMYAAFINPFIYLPLLLLGIEKILRKESPIVFVSSVFVSLCSNFYFFYMLVILAVIYYLIRYFTINVSEQYHKEKKSAFFQFLKDTMRIFVFALVGVLMSLVIFLPILIAFFNQGREVYSNLNNLFFYNLTEYMQLVSAFISPKILKNYNLLGYCPIIIIAIILLFRTKNKAMKEVRALKVGFIVLSMFLMIPIFSSMMNGFSYSNNRWLFGYAFLLALIVEFVLGNLQNYTKKDYRYVYLVIIGYILLVLFFETFQTKSVMMGAVWLLVFAIAFVSVKGEARTRIPIITTLCICCCTYYGAYYYSQMSGFDMSQLKNFGEANSTAENTAANAIKKIKDDDFYRVDISLDEIKNEALVLKYHPTAFYYSLFQGNITKFNKELVNAQTTVANLQKGNAGRTYLNLLTNTKYIVLDDDKQPIPYGYKFYDEYTYNSKTVQIYKNENALPLGYTYDSYLSYDEYEKLDVEKKEEAMLQTAILEKTGHVSEKFKEAVPQYHSQRLDYEIVNTENLKIQEDVIDVNENGGNLTLKVNVPEKSELMVYLEKIKMNEKQALDQFVIEAQVNQTSSNVTLQQSGNKFYWGQDNALLSLGNGQKGEQLIKITFYNSGKYNINDVQIICHNMENFMSQVDKLTENSFVVDTIKNNRVQGNISVDKDKILALGIPYSSGWKIYVDGEEKELLKVNTMWSGVMIEKGNHFIELKYCTPGIKQGGIISLVTAILFGGYLVIRRRTYHAKK